MTAALFQSNYTKNITVMCIKTNMCCTTLRVIKDAIYIYNKSTTNTETATVMSWDIIRHHLL